MNYNELLMKERHVKHLLAMSRKNTDGRGNVNCYTGHACDHYEEVMFALADSEIRDLAVFIIKRDPNAEAPADTPAMREAIRTFVGYGTDDEGVLWIAVCHDARCYPYSWSNSRIAACEVFVHGIVSHDFPFTTYTTPGPRAYCAKVCHKRTPHFFDVEVWVVREERYHIVLRCENCHHGYDLVTKDGSPSRWRRLMKDETARRLLAGARPER